MEMTSAVIEGCVAAVQQANRLIMERYARNINVRAKEDHSPVTDADMASHHSLVAALARLTPGIPVISEEAPPPLVGARYWLVDPLDGTRSFVSGDGEFSVNLGLVRGGVPEFGIIGLPVPGSIYIGGEGIGAWKIDAAGVRTDIHTRTPPPAGLTLVKSVSHPSPRMQGFIDKIKPHEVKGFSSALKFCMVAEGSADIYARFGRTMEWDTAAGHAIVNAAGGRVETEDGKPFRYGKPHYENGPFVAYGFPSSRRRPGSSLSDDEEEA